MKRLDIKFCPNLSVVTTGQNRPTPYIKRHDDEGATVN